MGIGSSRSVPWARPGPAPGHRAGLILGCPSVGVPDTCGCRAAMPPDPAQNLAAHLARPPRLL